MARKKITAKVTAIRGMGVIVTGESVARVKRALRLLDKPTKGAHGDECKKALNLYNMNKKFFEQDGRFKKPFTRKSKKAAKKVAAVKA